MDEPIASRRLIGVDSKGNEFNIEIKIGKPYQTAEHDWECAVAVEGLREKVMYVQDMDSFSVLVQAPSLVRHILETHEDKGGKLLWAFNRQPVCTKDEEF